MAEGYVYILTNPIMPGLVKVGLTTRTVEQRMKELSSTTAIPVPFSKEYEIRTTDCRRLERAVHKALRAYRINEGREFFKIPVDKAREIVEKLTPKKTPVAFRTDGGDWNHVDV